MSNRRDKTISIDDVVEALRNYVRSEKPSSVLSFVSELTGLSVDALSDEIYQNYLLDFSKVDFRDFDDSALPVEFFFDYHADKEQLDDYVRGLGYRADICQKVSFCLSMASLDDVLVSAILAFDDGEERSVELNHSNKDIESFIAVMEACKGTRGLNALLAFDNFVDDNLGEICEGSDKSINQEKLKQYLEDEMILEFPSAEDCLAYFNSYENLGLQSVAAMKRYQGMFGFGLDGKWYHVNYREALSVWEPLSFADKLQNAIQKCHYYSSTNDKLHVYEKE